MRERLHSYTQRTLGAGGSYNDAVSSINSSYFLVFHHTISCPFHSWKNHVLVLCVPMCSSCVFRSVISLHSFMWLLLVVSEFLISL